MVRGPQQMQTAIGTSTVDVTVSVHRPRRVRSVSGCGMVVHNSVVTASRAVRQVSSSATIHEYRTFKAEAPGGCPASEQAAWRSSSSSGSELKAATMASSKAGSKVNTGETGKSNVASPAADGKSVLFKPGGPRNVT